jgi:predicted ribonuclease YlaK
MARKSSVDLQIVESEHSTKNSKIKTGTHNLRIKIDDLKTFDPLTENQKIFFDAYKRQDYFIALHGVAGTGKTFCALYKALEEVLDRNNPFQKIIVVRSAVQSREIGHLPGDVHEKMEIYQQPYRQICETLFGRRDAWDRLEEQGHIEFISTSFIRGMSFDDAIIIVDECQNLSFEEIDTVMTRVDYRQTDLNKKKNDVSGILKFFDIAYHMAAFTRVEFTVEDIVRSSLVKDYIIAKLKVEDLNN